MTIRLALAAITILAAALLRPLEEARPPRRAKASAKATIVGTDDPHHLSSLPDPLERVRGEAPLERVSAGPPPLPPLGEPTSVLEPGRPASVQDDVAHGLARTASSPGPIESRYEAYRALAYAGREGLLDPDLRKSLLREYEQSALARR